MLRQAKTPLVAVVRLRKRNEWVLPKGKLDDGRKVTVDMVERLIPEEIEAIQKLLGPAYLEGRYEEAARIFRELVTNDRFVEFLTLPAYERID